MCVVQACTRVCVCGAGIHTCVCGAGLQNYWDRYGDSIHRVVSTFGPPPPFKGPLAERIAAEVNKVVPLDQLAARRRWRDERLAELARLKQRLAD